jgi:hypothetical protein
MPAVGGQICCEIVRGAGSSRVARFSLSQDNGPINGPINGSIDGPSIEEALQE